MTKPKKPSYELSFDSITEKGLTFDASFRRILSFMKEKPNANYRLMMGTDSQVHGEKTVFVTGIMIHREGNGAWACIRKTVHPRAYDNLHEKISMETSLTEEIACLFTEQHKQQMIDIVLPHIYNGASFTIEGHIDIGRENRSKTRVFIREMVSRIESLGLEPKIKPYSIAASAYANRHTK